MSVQRISVSRQMIGRGEDLGPKSDPRRADRCVDRPASTANRTEINIHILGRSRSPHPVAHSSYATAPWG